MRFACMHTGCTHIFLVTSVINTLYRTILILLSVSIAFYSSYLVVFRLAKTGWDALVLSCISKIYESLRLLKSSAISSLLSSLYRFDPLVNILPRPLPFSVLDIKPLKGESFDCWWLLVLTSPVSAGEDCSSLWILSALSVLSSELSLKSVSSLSKSVTSL